MARAPYLMPDFSALAVGETPVVDAIVARVEREIAAGRLPAGARLAPVRAIQEALGVARGTVQAALDELAERGLVQAWPRRGVFVAAPAGEALGERAQAQRRARRVAAAPGIAVRPLATGGQATARPGEIDLSTPFVDAALLPGAQLEDCVRSVMHQPGWRSAYDAQGYPPLREAIADRLRARGMDVRADDIVTTTGSQQAIDIVVRALATRRVAHENPVYEMARLLFDSLAEHTTALPLSPFEPVDRDAWAARLAADAPSLLYTITSFHNPTGRSMSLDELTWLLELCAGHGVGLLEDDWGSDMLPEPRYRPTLRALGGREVFYVNSFTKKLWPSLRLGFVAGNARTVPALVEAKRLSSLGCPVLMEAALFEFLDRGYFDTHLSRLQRELDARYQACLRALAELMPDGVRWTRPAGGPSLWLELPRKVDLDWLGARLRDQSVHIRPARGAFEGEPHLHGFALAYARHPIDAMRCSLERLAAALAEA